MDAKFYVLNFSGIAFFIFLLGPLGMADDVYGDDFVVYDSAKNNSATGDFDINRLRYNPPQNIVENKTEYDLVGDSIDSSEIVQNPNTGNLQWTGSNSDHGGDYGYIVYDISNLSSNIYIEYSSSGFFQQNVAGVVGNESYDPSKPYYNQSGSITELRVSEIDPTSCGSTNNEQCQWLELQIQDTDSSIERVSNYEEDPRNSAFASINNFLNTALGLVVGTLSMFASFVDFALSLPGLIGSFLRIYTGILLSVLIFLEGWIG